jgi:hypothetical protein
MSNQTLPFPNYELVSAKQIGPAEKVLRERAIQGLRSQFPNLTDWQLNKIINKFVSE